MQILYYSPMLLGLMMLIAVSIAATALWLMTRPREGPGFWMAGSVALLTGVLLFMLFTVTRNPVVNVLANALQLAGEAVFLLGIFRFMGRPLPYWIIPASVLVVVAFNIHYWLTDGSSDFLMGVYSTAAGLLPVQAIWLLLRERSDAATRPARLLVGFSLLVYSVVTLARGALSYRDWWLDMPYVQPYESFSYLLPYNFAIPAMVMGFVGVTLMTMQRVLDELSALARIDPLTGAMNRRSLTEAFANELLRLQRHPRPLALAMLDLDHFKAVNDRHGHQAGDRALQQFVAVCRQRMRATDQIARFGGEEFAILMPDTDADGARRILQRLLDDLASFPVQSGHGAFTIAASAGIAEWRPGDTTDTLLSRADRALYRAKQQCRNRIEYSGPDPDTSEREAWCV